MTLIIKELVIRGIVTEQPKKNSGRSIDKKELQRQLDRMEKSIKKECVDAVMSKLETRKTR